MMLGNVGKGHFVHYQAVCISKHVPQSVTFCSMTSGERIAVLPMKRKVQSGHQVEVGAAVSVPFYMSEEVRTRPAGNPRERLTLQTLVNLEEPG